MSEQPPKPESKLEAAKRASGHLRGTIAETLASDATHLGGGDAQLIKFHGAYQQDDRDERRERRSQGLDKAYQFMVRCAIPGGRLTAEQYLALDALSDRHGGGSLRITTRQGLQFHGVLQDNLKDTIARINQTLVTTLGACGDVNRNVMACPAPLGDRAHVLLRELSGEIARQLRPASRAYHQIWLDEEQVASTQPPEPFYGDQYLPRKFKTTFALDTDNCTDVYGADCGLIAMVEDSQVQGFNVLAGGGMGMTHGKADTFAKLAEPLGFVQPDHVVETVRTVAAIFRDHGNRADRRHARLKYLIAEWGMDRFQDEVRRRLPFELAQWRPLPAPAFQDHLGRHEQGDGQSFLGLFIESGRIRDANGRPLKTALRTVINEHRPGVSLTPQQNLLLTGLDHAAIDQIEAALTEQGVGLVSQLSLARRYSMACPALPTCGLAIGEAERVMPSVIDRFEAELEALGVGDVPTTLRMTGCPNGCARPYTADLAFVGRPKERYDVYVGGRLAGDRAVDLFAVDVPVGDLVTVLRPLLRRWLAERQGGEGLGDFYQRLAKRAKPRLSITGKEEPTQDALGLAVVE